MTGLPDAVHEYVVNFARQHAADHVLVLCRDCTATMPLRTALGDTKRVRCVDNLQALVCPPETGERVDLAIVVDLLGGLSHAAGRQLLSHLRDTKAAAVLAIVGPPVSGSRYWALADFIALGFRRSPDSRDLAPGWSLYRYAIHDYKITPGWLNSRYWANPERWGDDRW